MFFEQGLSGLNAAALSLNITGKNIANGSTTGYKTSSIDFTNVMANTLNTANSGVSLSTGSGPVASNIVQSFTQGTISTTNNPLDVAINGKGFFQMQDPTTKQMVYTRDGQFQMTSQYNIVNSVGQQLTGFPAGVTSGVAVPINLAAYQTTASAKTTLVTANINLAASTAPSTKPFDPTDSSSYAYSAPTQGYDVAGNQYTLNLYFAKDPASTSSAPVWNLYTSTASPATATDFAKIGQLTFDSKGVISGLATIAAPTTKTDSADLAAVKTAIGKLTSPTASDIANAASTAIAASTTLSASQISAIQATLGAIASVKDASVQAVTDAAEAVATDNQNLFSANNVAVAGNTFTNIPVDTSLSAADVTAINGITSTKVADAMNSAISAVSKSTSLNSLQIIAAVNNIVKAANQSGASLDTIKAAALQAGNGAGNVVTLDMSSMTQQGLSSVTTSLKNTGSTIGNLSSFVIGPDGAITGTYSNGQTANLGMIALANFASPTGLTPQGNNSWVASANSGKPIVGAPGSGGLGALQASAIENSNEDQTSDMVALLAAQRAYQANAQTIKAEDQMAQTLVNL